MRYIKTRQTTELKAISHRTRDIGLNVAIINADQVDNAMLIKLMTSSHLKI